MIDWLIEHDWLFDCTYDWLIDITCDCFIDNTYVWYIDIIQYWWIANQANHAHQSNQSKHAKQTHMSDADRCNTNDWLIDKIYDLLIVITYDWLIDI